AAVAQLAPPLLPLSAALFAYTAIPSLTGAYNVLFKERRLGVAARPDVARNSMPPGEEVRFAVDSPVAEADSNRRSLPVNELVSQAGMRMRARRQGWSRTRRPCSGTTGSNPLSSSREMVWGRRRRRWHHRRWQKTDGVPRMPPLNDLSRSLVALDQDSTIIAVVELSQSSWLVAGVLPGIERQPQKKLEPSAERLLG